MTRLNVSLKLHHSAPSERMRERWREREKVGECPLLHEVMDPTLIQIEQTIQRVKNPDSLTLEITPGGNNTNIPVIYSYGSC